MFGKAAYPGGNLKLEVPKPWFGELLLIDIRELDVRAVLPVSDRTGGENLKLLPPPPPPGVPMLLVSSLMVLEGIVMGSSSHQISTQ